MVRWITRQWSFVPTLSPWNARFSLLLVLGKYSYAFSLQPSWRVPHYFRQTSHASPLNMRENLSERGLLIWQHSSSMCLTDKIFLQTHVNNCYNGHFLKKASCQRTFWRLLKMDLAIRTAMACTSTSSEGSVFDCCCKFISCLSKRWNTSVSHNFAHTHTHTHTHTKMCCSHLFYTHIHSTTPPPNTHTNPMSSRQTHRVNQTHH